MEGHWPNIKRLQNNFFIKNINSLLNNEKKGVIIMVRKIFRTLLLIGVLFFSVLFCIEFIKERNILSAVLAGTVCLLTIKSIIVVYNYGFGSQELALTILGTLYFLGTKDIVLIVISFQLLELLIYKSEGFDLFFSKLRDSALQILLYSALFACIFSIFNIKIFDFLHIAVLVISCIPLLLLLSNIFIRYMSSGATGRIFFIASLILLILSIIMRVWIADVASGHILLYSIIALVTSYLRFIKKDD